MPTKINVVFRIGCFRILCTITVILNIPAKRFIKTFFISGQSKRKTSVLSIIRSRMGTDDESIIWLYSKKKKKKNRFVSSHADEKYICVYFRRTVSRRPTICIMPGNILRKRRISRLLFGFRYTAIFYYDLQFPPAQTPLSNTEVPFRNV